MQKLIDSYIDEIEAGMQKFSKSEREALVVELRQHLDALVKAQGELGQTDEDAAKAAIEQFGQASTVQKGLVSAYRRRRLARFRQSWLGAILLTIGSFFFIATLSTLILEPLVHIFIRVVEGRTFVWIGLLRMSLTLALFGWLAAKFSGAKCLPILAAYGICFYAMYLAPQLRHDDMPNAIRSQTLTSGLLFMAAPIIAALVSLRRTKRPHAAP